LTRALLCLVATACALVLLLTYRVPRVPLAEPVDRSVAASPPPKAAGAGNKPSGAKPATSGPPARWAVSDRGELQVIGPPVGWPYGHVQVKVTLEGSRIMDVAVVEMVTTNPVSCYRSQAAVARLRGSVLEDQGADVDVVTGATYTSDAYLRSLQAALDMVHGTLPGR
jgi:FMN-binding protein